MRLVNLLYQYNFHETILLLYVRLEEVGRLRVETEGRNRKTRAHIIKRWFIFCLSFHIQSKQNIEYFLGANFLLVQYQFGTVENITPF